MKKIFLILVLSAVFVGCGSKSIGESIAQETDIISSPESLETEKILKEESIESVVEERIGFPTLIAISTEIGRPVGDRTADNVSKENGDYFAIGSDVVACADYDSIHVIAQLTNTREELLKTAAVAWSAEMEDGYALDIFQNGISVGAMNDGTLGKQIKSNRMVTVEFDIYKRKDVKGDKVILKYNDFNYNDQYTEFINLALSGASEEECKKAYSEYFDEELEQQFEIELK